MGPVKKYNVTIFLTSGDKLYFELTIPEITSLEFMLRENTNEVFLGHPDDGFEAIVPIRHIAFVEVDYRLQDTQEAA